MRSKDKAHDGWHIACVALADGDHRSSRRRVRQTIAETRDCCPCESHSVVSVSLLMPFHSSVCDSITAQIEGDVSVSWVLVHHGTSVSTAGHGRCASVTQQLLEACFV